MHSEAGHIVAFYYMFNSLDSFEWASVDLNLYLKNNIGVECRFGEYPKYNIFKKKYPKDIIDILKEDIFTNSTKK